MSLHRASLLLLAGLFSAAMTSVASAGCCGWGVQAPVFYGSGCGGCGTPTAAVVYAQPVAPAPLPFAWYRGCGCPCGCPGLLSYPVPAAEPVPIAPAPIYVVNQGPDYTGPGIEVPYHTWTPVASDVWPGSYPYFSGYGYGYGYRYGVAHRARYWPPVRVAYHHRFYGHQYYRRPTAAWPAFHHYHH